MRYLIFILFFSLPCTAGAAIAAPISLGEAAIAQQAIPEGFAPKKQRFFDRIAKNILQKRIKKALGRNSEGAAKLLSVLGFTFSALGVILLFASSGVAALVLLLIGLVLSIFGLTLSSSDTEKWVKALAISGIVLCGLVVLLFFAVLILLIAAFS